MKIQTGYELIMTKKHSKATWQCDSTWWPTLEVMSCIKRPNFEPIYNKSENAYFNEINIAGGTTDPGIASIT